MPRLALSATAAIPAAVATAISIAIVLAVSSIVASCGSQPVATVAPAPTPSAVTALLPHAATPEPIIPASSSDRSDPPIEYLRVEVVETFPHDPTAYTQGLELVGGFVIESTGREGHPNTDSVFASDLRRVDLVSGEVVARTQVPGDVFAEGTTLVGDQFVQITWQDERVLRYDAATLELVDEGRYEGAGWGLCLDGDRLVMTDGTAIAQFRDPVSFEVIGTVTITVDGTSPVEAVNELECVDGRVWGNIYQTDTIIRFDPQTGIIDRVVDGSTLGQPRSAPAGVLNGIAYDAASDTFLLTGKFWPTMYRVTFVPVGQ